MARNTESSEQTIAKIGLEVCSQLSSFWPSKTPNTIMIPIWTAKPEYLAIAFACWESNRGFRSLSDGRGGFFDITRCLWSIRISFNLSTSCSIFSHVRVYIVNCSCIND